MITKRISPSQEEPLVEMDESGPITAITTPSGDRMTAWYDGTGTRQVLNQSSCIMTMALCFQ